MSDATNRARLMALVGVIEGERRATHTAGYPLDPSKMLPLADVVVLVPDDDGPGAMLFRYTAHGEVAGDSWHPAVEEARRQAAEEYGEALQGWETVPDDQPDAHLYAVKVAADRLNSRGDW
ncbi:MAG TPA: hypothetical protein VKA84_29680 [Gemmatimonadaceae bacterium]|nr:hypothetical protein [Gemmatimonadaceae bacterium]